MQNLKSYPTWILQSANSKPNCISPKVFGLSTVVLMIALFLSVTYPQITVAQESISFNNFETDEGIPRIVSFGDFTTYRKVRAWIVINNPNNKTIKFERIDTPSSGSATTAELVAPSNNVNAPTATSAWGTWTVFIFTQPRSYEVNFVPNATAINAVADGSDFKSELKVSLVNTSGTVSTSNTYTVNIERESSTTVTMSRTSGGMQKYNPDGIRTNYENLIGSVAYQNPPLHYAVNGAHYGISYFETDKEGTRVQGQPAGPQFDEVITELGTETINLLGRNFTYGVWFTNPSVTKFMFRPNIDALNTLQPGETVKSELKVQVSEFSSSRGFATRGVATFVVTITGVQPPLELTLPWDDTTHNGTITSFQGLTVYQDLVGTNKIVNSREFMKTEYSATEQKTGGTLTNGSKGTTTEIINNQSLEIRGDNFIYGKWYVPPNATHDSKFLYRPDATEINKLQVGDSVTSILTVKIQETDNTGNPTISELDEEMITVVINRVQTQTVIVLTWDSGMSEESIVGDGTSNYSDFAGTVQLPSNPTSPRIEISVSEQKNSDNAVTGASPAANLTNLAAGFMATPYGSNLEFGTWYFATANDQLLFRPNSNNINSLAPNDTVVLTLTAELYEEMTSTVASDTKEISIRITRQMHTQLSLAWESSTPNGNILVDTSTTNYSNIKGIVTSNNLPTSPHSFQVEVFEESDLGNVTVNTGVFNSSLGYDANQFLGDLQYGSWFFASDNSQFTFRPNTEEINKLQSGDKARSTLTVSILNESSSLEILPTSISVLITNETTKPIVSISANAETVTLGSVIDYTISIENALQADTDIDLQVTDPNNIVLWRIPNSINLPAQAESATFSISTNRTAIFQGNAVNIAVQLLDSPDVSANRIDSYVLVRVEKDDGQSTSQTRVSVANAVVTAILADPSGRSIEPQLTDVGSNIKPIVSISAVESKIEEGSVAQFQLKASERISRTINVNLTVLNSGNFIKGTIPQTIHIPPTNSPYHVSIETEDDTAATPDGMISIEILSGEDYVVGDSNIATVIVSDLADRLRAEQVANLNQRVMSQILSSVSERSISTISNRLHYANDLSADPTFKLGNSHSLSDFITINGELLNNNLNSWYSLLDDTSFLISLNPEGRGDRATTIWGHSDYLTQTLSSSQFARSASGEGYVGNLGLDAQLGNYSFTGIAVSGSRIESSYEFNEIGSIDYDSQLTILSPYVKFTNSTQDAYLSAIFGIGSGTTAINEAEGTPTTQSNRIVSATLIGNQPIYSFTNAQRQSSSELSFYGQSGWQVHNLNYLDNQNNVSEVNRNLQVGATATYEQKLIDAGAISTIFSYEIVGDHRDGETILGQELTNDTKFAHQSGLSLSLASEFVFTPTTQGHRTAISGAIAFDRHQDEVGLMIELTPTWVKTEGQVFNSQSNDHFLVAGDRGWTDPSNSKLTTEFSFGLPVFDATGIVTPYTAYELVAGEESLFDVGVSMQTFNNLQMTLNYRQTPTYSKRHDFQLRSNLKW